MLTFDEHLRAQLQLLQQFFTDEEKQKVQHQQVPQQPKQKDEQK